MLASRPGTDCSVALSTWMYLWYASDVHLTRVFMSHIGRPAAAAVVAAPIRKLWLAYAASLMPSDRSRDRRVEVRRVGVRYEPS